MEEIGVSKPKTHKVLLSNRRTCTLSGVMDVISFDMNEVLLETDLGMLIVKGMDLHVNRLTLEKGEVDIDGTIDSLTYSDRSIGKGKGESMLTRLFK